MFALDAIFGFGLGLWLGRRVFGPRPQKNPARHEWEAFAQKRARRPRRGPDGPGPPPPSSVRMRHDCAAVDAPGRIYLQSAP